jgi:RNA polymerase sigma-70 factor (ECF subfamily)
MSSTSHLTAPERFGEIFERHFDAVHRYLARRIGVERAGDLAAQTFVTALELRARFRVEAVSARPWLLGIATNLMRNERRRELRSLQCVAALAAEPPADRADGTPGGEGGDPMLARALAELESGQREALLLLVWGELSYAEVAEALGIPIGTIRSRISRARSNLRAALSLDQPEPAVGTASQAADDAAGQSRNTDHWRRPDAR